MKDIKLADTLFASTKELKTVISKTNTGILNADSLFQAKEYVAILEKLFQVASSIELGNHQYANSVETLHMQMEALHSAFDLENFYSLYLNSLKCFSKELILYRGQYCVIRRNDPVPGLASHIITNLGQIGRCLKEGYIPVIDMQNADNLFTPLSKITGVNAWELFFKQPFGGYTLEDVSGCISHKIEGIPHFRPSDSMDCLTNNILMDYWRDMMLDHMPLSLDMEGQLQAYLEGLPFGKSKILGVLCRGTDYSAVQPDNHPVQPDYHIVLEDAERIMNQYQCEYCYLVTEDENIRMAFEQRLQNSLLTTQQLYFLQTDQELLSNQLSEQVEHLYAKNQEYLCSLFLLSHCDCLLTGRTSGAVVSLMLKHNYEYLHIYNQGRYGVDHRLLL